MRINSTCGFLRPVLAAGLCFLFATIASVGFGQTDDSMGKIKTEQQQLADRYKQLEAKLFSLHQFEKDSNPGRSKLLQKAFLQSQEKMTNVQLDRAVKLINSGKFKDAEKIQNEALSSMTEMLKLLQSEDRSQQVRDEIDLYKEYLKEVERLERLQKGIRGQTEAGLDQERLAKSQASTERRTADLSEKIQSDQKASSGENSESKETEGSPSEGSESEGSESKGSESKGSESKGSESEGSESEGSESEGSESEGSESEGSESEGSESEGSESEGSESEGSESNESDSVQEKIARAQQRMKEAGEALKDARRDNATDKMEEAERELAAAKKELEEILRQLREEEVESKLKLLEERFRGMLEQQIRVNEATDKLSLTPSEARATEFEISANRLAGDQNEIVTAAGRTLLLLKADGGSIAFPVTVEEMQQDMQQVSARLSAAKVNAITQGIEADIVTTLNELIEALIKAQEDLEEQQQSQSQQPGEGTPPGESPLVDQIAEMKMLRSLQKRIYSRHQRYAKYLDNPDDPMGVSEEPDVVAALDRLAEKQAQLTDITRQLVNEKNE